MPILSGIAIKVFNLTHDLLWPRSRPVPSSPELQEIQDRARSLRNDISDHLPTIFSEAASIHPRLIVELGVRDGSSRFALERAARINGTTLLSLDIDDCSSACDQAPKWHFLRQDDIHFASIFQNWCAERGIEPGIDVLFIDTSHFYDHTVQEINAWFPHLSARCKVMFHDTNLRHFYRRLDGTIGRGWNNRRGVIRALEDCLGAKFNESLDFVTTVNEWIVRHWAHSNGLTVLERTRPANAGGSRVGAAAPNQVSLSC